jgi:mannitol/fructose-specific phosphotransferase system IIA component (Ntr-type)
MHLSNHLTPDLILTNINPANKAELISIMSECVTKASAAMAAGLTKAKIEEATLDREAIASTGIGGGFAFPHARMAELDGLCVCLAILKNPLEYDAIDKQPVWLACMALAPEKNPTLALKVMSQAVRLFSSNKNIKNQVLHAADSAEVYNFIRNSSASLDIPITARDIMQKPFLEIKPTMSLKKVTHIMAEKNLNVVAVVDDYDCILGEISCDRLLRLGLPDFFTQLKSVAFIADFDPFEKYFYEESISAAGDVMDLDFCAMPPDATMLEIVFALTIKKFPKVYVVDDGRLIGLIDQSAVLRQIINI